MPEYHAYSQTVADGTATSVVRPSDWNSAHLFSSSLAGNTLGQSTFSGSNLVLAGGNNITLSASQAAGQATISFEGLARQSNSVYLFGNTAGISSSLTNNPAVANLAGGVNVTVNYTTNTAGNRIVEILGQEHAVSCPNGSSTFKTLSFQNTNGVTWNTAAAGVRLAHELQYTSNAVGLGTSFSGTNISGSMTVNTNGIALAMSADAGGGGNQKLSFFHPFQARPWVVGQMNNGGVAVFPYAFESNYSFDRMVVPIQFTQATNSTMTVTCSVGFGLYTKNGSTLSLESGYTGSFSINGSGTASSAQNSGFRVASVAVNGSIPTGNYWIGFWSRTATAGVNATLSNYWASQVNSVFSGNIGEANALSQAMHIGMGTYTATSSGIPAALPFSQIGGTGSFYGIRPPVFWLTNGTL